MTLPKVEIYEWSALIICLPLAEGFKFFYAVNNTYECNCYIKCQYCFCMLHSNAAFLTSQALKQSNQINPYMWRFLKLTFVFL